MKHPFKQGTKIQVASSCDDYWYKVGEIYTVHSYLPHEDAYVVEEQYEEYKESAWIDAKDVIQFVDWDNAPEGATHYNDVDCIYPYLKQTWDSYYFFDEEKWTEYNYVSLAFAHHFDNAIKRPVTEEKKEMNAFNKNGLPAVGTEFEYSFGNDFWFKATSNYVVADDGVVALCESACGKIEQYLDVRTCKFRSIKSKEEQEKEEAVDEMVKVADPSGTLYNSASLFCERLYAAGYRIMQSN